MAEEIINKVAQSKLVTFDLEDYYPKGERKVLDLKGWLYEGIILREKEFRTFLAEYDWEQYTDAFVALTCSTDAIVPGWAYMLVTTKLQPYAKNRVVVNFAINVDCDGIIVADMRWIRAFFIPLFAPVPYMV